MCTAEEYKQRAHFVKETFKQEKNWKSLRYQYHDVGTTLMEGVFARGDRRVADVIEHAYRDGAMYDAWTEYFDEARWANAFEACAVDPDFYTRRERSTDELLPWDFIDCGVSKGVLKAGVEQCLAGEGHAELREHCSRLTAQHHIREEVCFENKN